MAIQSFADKDTQNFFVDGKVPRKAGWAQVKDIVRRKLDALHFATQLETLKVPPGNKLEALKGDLAGLHSIRVNDQWRVVFRWTDKGPEDVRVCDYH